ncbi:DUF1295 domain-containing protein [Treponema phagedenis]|uniref:3-oxo-5-alpha-steroid 4-dehydrogenase 1 n=1 Tax=Treponema phagedenis TaxID=162 RepID=A0A0B7GT49_TREPH|nr:DUF1295 domain-containing protein [Treponema phagedenis]EFW36992.1 3-oxo-5-alpha-steroid 4-dehydrogenase [Treponema phagedenis F0421]NVP23863.1 DUF1295 domain-containing protein [Treponema phagedenis]QEJ96543.1 DUF1295 domain-containing protein [Treponema phagedenis]QEJ99712.1 DUF1295 domain-containing protein [Treponema phagedenis]QEK02330.1 DUF1295 domain-containing protein [Treponema phagedenis]
MEKLLFAFTVAQLVLFVFGLICFVVLFFVPAGYGKMIDKKWGYSFNNKAAWFIMEVPTLITMIVLMCVWATPENFVRIIIGLFFILHYTQRVLIFPFLLKGKSKMPLSIVLMGVVFNTINTFLIGAWLFYLSPKDMYQVSWLYDPRFIIGALIFLLGMAINIDSDKYIRSLRKAGDTAHYFPHKRMYRYVSSANYFGEILEWCGFALLSWSMVGVLFAFWTAANLVPRAYAINKKYRTEFPAEYAALKPKCVFPFIF